MYRIYDAHAHIYPEKIAKKAAESIGQFYDMPMSFGGTSAELIQEGEQFGVSRFLVHSVATSPRQVKSINDFLIDECERHADRFIGFATLHQDFERPGDELERVKRRGLMGVKLHPDFQKFYISDPALDEAYAAISELGLPILMHTGDARYNYSSPEHIPKLLRRHPRLKLICAHFGGYSRWEEAAELLRGESIWVDTSSSLYALPCETARAIIEAYGYDRVLFGSDYPMWSANDEIQRVLALGLPERVNQKLFSDNLSALLGL